MQREKEITKPNVSEAETLEMLLKAKTEEADYIDEQIILAVDELRKHFGMIRTRSYLMEMFLQHASKQKNDVDDKEHLFMLQVFQVFNVA